MPPSHFISSRQLSSAGSVTLTGAHIPPSVPQSFSGCPAAPWTPLSTSAPGDPWLAIAQTNKEILKLREENQRLKEKGDMSQISTHSAR